MKEMINIVVAKWGNVSSSMPLYMFKSLQTRVCRLVCVHTWYKCAIFPYNWMRLNLLRDIVLWPWFLKKKRNPTDRPDWPWYRYANHELFFFGLSISVQEIMKKLKTWFIPTPIESSYHLVSFLLITSFTNYMQLLGINSK